MKKETLVHVKLEYEEAIRTKKDILSAEMMLLRMIKRLNSYGAYRIAELELKAELYKKSKELKTGIANIQKILPKEEIHGILKSGKNHETVHEARIKSSGTDIESQLREIQRKLERLQNEESLIK